MSIRALPAAGVVVAALCACESDKTCPTSTPTGPVIGHPPVIEALGDTSVVLGDTLRLQTSVSDPDGDAVTLHLTVIHRPGEALGYTPDVTFESLSGELYVIEVVQQSGRNWLGQSFGEPGYDRGRQISGGQPQDWNDLWFREGARSPLPSAKSSLEGE